MSLHLVRIDGVNKENEFGVLAYDGKWTRNDDNAVKSVGRNVSMHVDT